MSELAEVIARVRSAVDMDYWPLCADSQVLCDAAERTAQLEAQDTRWRETATDYVDLVHAHEALDIEAAGLRKRVAQLEAELAAAQAIVQRCEDCFGQLPHSIQKMLRESQP